MGFAISSKPAIQRVKEVLNLKFKPGIDPQLESRFLAISELQVSECGRKGGWEEQGIQMHPPYSYHSFMTISSVPLACYLKQSYMCTLTYN